MSDTVNFGDALVSPEEKTRRVGQVFSSVARRYDLMNDLMSGGLHRRWKSSFVKRVKPRAGEDILDMAGGTGDIAFRMASRGARVTIADINPDMLLVGQDRARQRGIAGLEWREENAESLSFEAERFDAYTIAFGIRNVTDIPAALREAHRVVKRGGRFYCLEFSTSDWPGIGVAAGDAARLRHDHTTSHAVGDDRRADELGDRGTDVAGAAHRPGVPTSPPSPGSMTFVLVGKGFHLRESSLRSAGEDQQTDKDFHDAYPEEVEEYAA